MSYQTKLKDNAWIDAYQLADWLNIKEEKLNVASDKSYIVFKDITFRYFEGGADGDNYKIEFTGGATAGSEVIESSSSPPSGANHS